MKGKETEKNQEIGKFKGAVESYEKQLTDTEETVRQADPTQRELFFPVIEGKLTDKNLSLSSIVLHSIQGIASPSCKCLQCNLCLNKYIHSL